MSPEELLQADLTTTGATTGPHPMALWRSRLEASSDCALRPSPLRASDLSPLPHGAPVTVAGMVICRQRPGTAKGHCFLSLEDETGLANLFVPRDTFHRLRLVITSERFLLACGRLQRSEGDQATLYVTDLVPLPRIDPALATGSRDFH